jgi:hypothetical protein
MKNGHQMMKMKMKMKIKRMLIGNVKVVNKMNE